MLSPATLQDIVKKMKGLPSNNRYLVFGRIYASLVFYHKWPTPWYRILIITKRITKDTSSNMFATHDILFRLAIGR